MVEFALIIGVFLLFVFVIIESGRLFQAWQTTQNTAWTAARFALTGQYDPDCLFDTPPCHDARVHAIKERAREATTGIVIDPNAGFFDPNYFLVEVFGMDENNVLIPDYAGAPGKPVVIRVVYRMPLITPLVNSFVGSIPLVSTVTVNNEQFDQVAASQADGISPGTDIDIPPVQPPTPDLYPVKTGSPDPVVVNTPLEYTINIYNQGTATATGITLTDTLPADVQFVSATPGCAHSGESTGGVVVCENLGQLPPNPQLSLTVNINVIAPESIPDSPWPIHNTVTVAANEPENNTSNNTDILQTTVINPGSDMELVSLSAFPPQVTVGENFEYSIVARHNGPNDWATDVVVSQILPATVTFVAAPGCDHAGGTVTCEVIGPLARNESVVFNVTVTAPNEEGPISTEATVTAEEYDPFPDNNSRTLTTEVVPAVSDLWITKSGSPEEVMTGEEITYLVQVVNQGPAVATGVTVVDTLPPDTTFISAAPSQGSCGAPVNGILACDLGSIGNAPGANSANISIVITANDVGTITNQAEVSANEDDPDPTNNIAFATTEVVEADMAIDKSSSVGENGEIDAGDELRYILTVTNNGPSDATNVVVTDPLPDTFHYVGYTSSQATCSHTGQPTGGTVTCNLGEMASSATANIELTVIPTMGGGGQGDPIDNTATVSAEEGDPNLANNSDTTTVRVQQPSAAFITLSPSCGDLGSTLTINGYNFPSQTRLLTITFDPGGAYQQVLFSGDSSGASWSKEVTIPNNVPFDYYTIEAVKHNRDAEAIFKVPCPKPDLIISQPELVSSEPITTHTPVTFRAVISNVGDADAINQFFVGLYFNPDPPPDSDTTHISSEYRTAVVGISGLTIGSSRVVTLTAENGFPVTGTHDVYVVVDSDPEPTGVVAELDETNNIGGPLVVEVTTEGDPPEDPPDPSETGGVQGVVQVLYEGSIVPQANALIRAYDDDGILRGSTNSGMNGGYSIENLPPGSNYTVTGCIVLDNEDYFWSASGIEIFAEEMTRHDFVLIKQPCS